MISKITAIILAVVTFISNFAALLPGGSEFHYDVAYGSHPRQLVDIAFPEEYQQEQSVILFIHGGGWIAGRKDGFTAKALPLSEDTGCITASMSYRYATKDISCEDMLDDIDAALAKIKSMAETRGIKATKVMLVGFSAGAHLSLLYAYKRKNTAPIEPAVVFSYSGPTDLTSELFVEHNALSGPDYMRTILSYLIGERVTVENFASKKNKILACSPIKYVSSSCVPTVIVQGAKDRIVYARDSRNFAKSLKAKGVTFKYIELPNSGHTLDDDPDVFSESNKVFAACIKKFLK